MTKKSDWKHFNIKSDNNIINTVIFMLDLKVLSS